ncbi:MAG: hypothetical protein JKY24_00210 [Pseudomonadales bacterium]|nr:hypothetical protein [Pseudomonadales bacterium]
MTNLLTRIATAVVTTAVIGFTPIAAATPSTTTPLVERTMCVFDPIGASGPLHEVIKEYQIAALGWGVRLDLKSYNDERVASEDFKAGICDIVDVSGIRARSYNEFTGTIDSIGAIPTYEHLRTILGTLSTKKAAKYMISGEYEIATILPVGALYGFVADRSIRDIKDLAGKKITVLDNTPEMQLFVAQAGLTPVPATLATVFSKFNNHTVDITGAPAIAYEPMELYKGLEPNGGILNFPLLQITLQVIIRRDKFPVDFAQQSREYAFEHFDEAIAVIKQSEDRIPKKYWINVPDEKKIGWTEVMRQTRIALVGEGIYNAKALTLFRKIRCSKEPDLAECSADDME